MQERPSPTGKRRPRTGAGGCAATKLTPAPRVITPRATNAVCAPGSNTMFEQEDSNMCTMVTVI
ncbi:hypothetical protein GCM10009526_31430 [Glutamicibacter creatinolyticus]